MCLSLHLASSTYPLQDDPDDAILDIVSQAAVHLVEFFLRQTPFPLYKPLAVGILGHMVVVLILGETILFPIIVVLYLLVVSPAHLYPHRSLDA